MLRSCCSCTRVVDREREKEGVRIEIPQNEGKTKFETPGDFRTVPLAASLVYEDGPENEQIFLILKKNIVGSRGNHHEVTFQCRAVCAVRSESSASGRLKHKSRGRASGKLPSSYDDNKCTSKMTSLRVTCDSIAISMYSSPLHDNESATGTVATEFLFASID